MNDEDKNKNLNPASQDISEKTDFDRLLQAEKSGAKPEESESSDLDDIKQKEESSDRQGFYRPSGKSNTKFTAASLKKRGPIGLIIAIVLGGGFGLSLLFSPGILLVQLKEVMVGKFNTQLASMDARTMRIIDAKTKEATKGACSTIKIKCRYASMSERQLKRFQAAGIDIKYEKTALGRYKPTSFRFKDADSIPANEFRSTMINNPDFRNAVRKAYNPKFAGFADATWTKVRTKLGLSEAAPSKSKDVEEKKKQLQEVAKNGEAGGTDVAKATAGEDHPFCDPNPCTEEDANRVNSDIDANAKTIADLDPGKVAMGAAVKSIRTGVTGSLGISGMLDTACQAYGAVQLTAYGAKLYRTIQLSRYAIQFLTVADMIKAGAATPEDVSQLGDILTAEAEGVDTNGNPRKSATDSYGYRYAAYGDVSSMNEYTSMFLAGGGLTGKLSEISGLAISILGGKEGIGKCRFLANPFVQAGSIIAGIAFAFTGVGTAKIIAQAAFAIGVSAALAVLPSLLSDIIAGNVTENIQGEDSGDAITSGSGSFMGVTANTGGNAPMTKDQALAYSKLQQETVVAYTKDEASTLSQLDASNRFTFMGALAYNLMPYYSKNAFSVGGTIGSSLSFVATSLKGIIPSVNAVTDEKEKAALNVCQDYDYQELGIATDPFCNPIFGIPPQYLNADPIEVVDELFSNGYYQLDSSGSDYVKTEKYEEFIKTCVEREKPFGYQDVTDSSSVSDGKDCIIDSKIEAYAYLNIIDERIENGMEGYDLPTGQTSTPTSGAIPTNLGNFVFPLKVTKSVMKNNWSCWNETDETCHGTESYGYYASDLFGETGTEIVAATDGIVGSIGYSSSTGHMINIKGNDCTDGTQTCKGQGTLAWYGHILQSSVLVKEGQEVTAGTPIGKIGTSAEANNTTPHLHIDFSDRKNQSRPSCSRQSLSLCKAAGFLNVQKYLHDAFMQLPE